jgi:hypothetical protein
LEIAAQTGRTEALPPFTMMVTNPSNVDVQSEIENKGSDNPSLSLGDTLHDMAVICSGALSYIFFDNHPWKDTSGP